MRDTASAPVDIDATAVKLPPVVLSLPVPTAGDTSINEINNQLASLGIKEDIPVFPDSNITTNPVDIFRSYIAKTLSEISGVDAKLIYPSLEWTTGLDKGDLVLAVPRLRLKTRPPAELAKEWAEKFPENPFIKKPVPSTQFLQFYFNENVLCNTVILQILQKKEHYGPSPIGKGKKVIVEFSSPNIAKPFHAGHLRSTIIGGFLSNLYEAMGWQVIRMNYLGDWGKQFGVLAVGFRKYGSEEQLTKDPIHHLFHVYVKINDDIKEEEAAAAALEKETGQKVEIPSPTNAAAREFFLKLEGGDPEANALWQRFRDLSIERYIETYKRLNIVYDVYSGESQVKKESMDKAAKILEERGLLEKDQGAVLIDLTKYSKKLGKAMIQKKDGTTLYLTRDIGAAMERWEQYNFDKMIYVVASQQDLHLQQLFKILELMGYEWANRCQHINFGMVLGMSTRSGTVVFLDTILEEAKKAMHNVMQKNEDKYKQVENPEVVADVVGRTGVMVQDMSGKRVNNYPFEMERMTSFEGDTGPYLQYAHSRLCSITRKAGISRDALLKANLVKHLSESTHAVNLLRALAQFPDVLLNTFKTHEPTTLLTYLFKMTHLLSSSYDVLRVVGETEEVAAARLALYESARQVLSNGMRILGLTPVERM